MTVENITEDQVPTHTHKATLTVYSDGDEKAVAVRVVWDPDIEGEDIEKLGYIPASYDFIQEYILPAIEQAYMDWDAGPLLNMQPPSQWRN